MVIANLLMTRAASKVIRNQFIVSMVAPAYRQPMRMVWMDSVVTVPPRKILPIAFRDFFAKRRPPNSVLRLRLVRETGSVSIMERAKRKDLGKFVRIQQRAL